jgi:solute carrier family 25 thiamine pyrophosphate transporter 19
MKIEPFLSGAIAGSVATICTYPFDLLRSRFAAQSASKIYYSSLTNAILKIYHEENIRGLYRGLTPTLMQIIPLMGLVFESNQFFKNRLTPTIIDIKYLNGSQDLICGAFAGAFSKTVCMPFDVIRKRIQIQGPLRNHILQNVPAYSSAYNCLITIIKSEGVFVFFLY